MDLTMLSNEEYINISKGSLLPEEAYAYLTGGISLRTFSQALAKYTGGRDIKKLLINKLSEYDPQANRDSIARKVRDWLKDKYEPSDRETYFKICFALKFDEDTAQSFLCTVSDGGIYYRDMTELTYAFAFRTGMDYPAARRLYDELPPAEGIAHIDNVYTQTVINDFAGVYDRNDFIDFCTRNLEKLGSLHNTAYERFMTYMRVLEAPDSELTAASDMEIEKSYSAENIAENYLRMNVPVNTKTAEYTYIQKIIKNIGRIPHR